MVYGIINVPTARWSRRRELHRKADGGSSGGEMHHAGLEPRAPGSPIPSDNVMAILELGAFNTASLDQQSQFSLKNSIV
eukprot:scaffold976_cov161-Amphora_coffeaeformis.AAC.2